MSSLATEAFEVLDIKVTKYPPLSLTQTQGPCCMPMPLNITSCSGRADCRQNACLISHGSLYLLLLVEGDKLSVHNLCMSSCPASRAHSMYTHFLPAMSPIASRRYMRYAPNTCQLSISMRSKQYQSVKMLCCKHDRHALNIYTVMLCKPYSFELMQNPNVWVDPKNMTGSAVSGKAPSGHLDLARDLPIALQAVMGKPCMPCVQCAIVSTKVKRSRALMPTSVMH